MSIIWSEVRSRVSPGTGIRDDAPDSRGSAVAATVQFLSTYANTAAINNRISHELRLMQPFANSQLEGCPNEFGVLAAAYITTESYGEMSASTFQYLNLVGPYYHFPDIYHALRRHYQQARFDVYGSSTGFRFFWGTR